MLHRCYTCSLIDIEEYCIQKHITKVFFYCLGFVFYLFAISASRYCEGLLARLQSENSLYFQYQNSQQNEVNVSNFNLDLQ